MAAELPGLGASFRARIPSDTDQVLLVSGSGKDSAEATATLWTRAGDGLWTPGAEWPAHNALKGWTDDHHLDDLRSPIGVYSLSDAGGLLADPGSKLRYHQSSGFTISGKGFEGENLGGSFDYVVAIDYNRVAGTSPLDGTMPLGASKGGGIWVHVDHGGPTHACISLSADHMVSLLRSLDPAAHPVIVMGDRASLAS
jgi:L,D-peptidoglycan transpeptidase YkuD (ErfK/YbiS/YcfS/YnhG family)